MAELHNELIGVRPGPNKNISKLQERIWLDSLARSADAGSVAFLITLAWCVLRVGPQAVGASAAHTDSVLLDQIRPGMP